MSTASYRHVGGDTALLGATIPEHVASVVAAHGDREAIVCLHQGRRLTYAQLAAEVDRLAAGLLGMGVAVGERVGVWSTDNVEWLVLQLATARVGAVLVNLNPAYRPRELRYALERSEIQVVFTIPAFRHSDYVGMLVEVIPALAEEGTSLPDPSLPHLRRVVVYDPADALGTARPHPGFTTWAEVLEAGAAVTPAEVDAVTATLDRDDPINIQYTSGTTGFPKAVVLTHHNLLNNAWFAARLMGFGEQDRLCVPVPFYHCFGMVLSNLLCLSVGACLVLPAEHFEAGAVLRAVARERCTGLHGVPTMFIAELDHPERATLDLSSLRTGIMAGAPCPEPLMLRVMEELHCREILIGYGQTEASPLTHLTRATDDVARRTQTVGLNLPHQEVKVVDTEDRRTLPLDTIGEICFRGYHVMRGYYGDPEATARAIDEAGWLHSGDLGTMDADGYVKITGRLKEMIIRGGENVYPAEIEARLFEHPDVAQAAVFGLPDERWGEIVVAWVEPHAGATLTEEAIQAWCREGLAHFKVPARVRIVDAFPMTVTGKLQKFRMREAELRA